MRDGTRNFFVYPWGTGRKNSSRGDYSEHNQRTQVLRSEKCRKNAVFLATMWKSQPISRFFWRKQRPLVRLTLGGDAEVNVIKPRIKKDLPINPPLRTTFWRRRLRCSFGQGTVKVMSGRSGSYRVRMAILGDEAYRREVFEPARELAEALFVKVSEFDSDA